MKLTQCQISVEISEKFEFGEMVSNLSYCDGVENIIPLPEDTDTEMFSHFFMELYLNLTMVRPNLSLIFKALEYFF